MTKLTEVLIRDQPHAIVKETPEQVMAQRDAALTQAEEFIKLTDRNDAAIYVRRDDIFRVQAHQPPATPGSSPGRSLLDEEW